ncbi:MAG: restriction endonuclease [Chloroflexi bacterium]|nr:restriction endonuclease [Chloroflexota bacterium]
MSRRSDMKTTYTKRGFPRYYVEIWHDELKKYQVVRGDNRYVVEQKARAKMAQWDDMWERKQAADRARLEREQRALDKKQKLNLAAEKTREAQASISALERVLAHTLGVDDAVDWEALKNPPDYPVARPRKPRIEKEPKRTDARYQVKLGFWDRLIPALRVEKLAPAEARFNEDHAAWVDAKEKAESEYARSLAEWERARDKYMHDRDENNATIDRKREAYMRGETEAILDYCDIVLSNSKYPDYFPQSYDLDFNPEGGFLIVDYQLPDSATIPTVREVRYVQSRDEFKETHIPKARFNKLYDSVLYQIALRTIHELFEADKINALASVVFNGYVRSVNPGTGREEVACILSVQANREEFEAINLANVDPRACFKRLKGISSSRLYSLTPIAPILRIDREDRRFVDSYAVAEGLSERENLAAMDWEDFEHLVRELFEEEFASGGGEVKITRASRDGGIDAVAFDPDPIRGGKIVIQAKRYTNTVGVSAVDLYGSVINEGAAKGILVTTADYGPDAYEFAMGKPLTLLNGSNLLHLLEKHGHKARIDIREAKRILAEKD